MGYLKDNGKFLTFEESKTYYQDYVKTHGILQFIHLFNAHKDRQIPLPDLKWGHESEYHLVHADPATKQMRPFTKVF